RLMTPADTFPYASCTSDSMQIDHTIPHAEGGATGVGNYGPMTTSHHRIKTHGGWQVQQPFPGIYLWRDPHGAHYLVDHTGTRRLRNTPDTTPEPPRPTPLVLELHHVPFTIELDLAG
ncbi:MAG TPA: HNH endonuclease signature motif containing protein, partial [Nocardioides sp.]|nr:HNH endonuclease signature motif containing protein [Nocardioides sp.]